MASKSPDAFRTISEVAEWLDTPAHVLRFWESKFTQVKPVKRAGGRRYYRPADMELIGGIKRLLHEDGMTIKGVQKILREQGVRHVAALSPYSLEGSEDDIAEEDAPFTEAEPAETVVPFARSTSSEPTQPGEATLSDQPARTEEPALSEETTLPEEPTISGEPALPEESAWSEEPALSAEGETAAEDPAQELLSDTAEAPAPADTVMEQAPGGDLPEAPGFAASAEPLDDDSTLAADGATEPPAHPEDALDESEFENLLEEDDATDLPLFDTTMDEPTADTPEAISEAPEATADVPEALDDVRGPLVAREIDPVVPRPAVLSQLARIDRVTPSQASRLAVQAAALRQLSDRMPAARN